MSGKGGGPIRNQEESSILRLNRNCRTQKLFLNRSEKSLLEYRPWDRLSNRKLKAPTIQASVY